MNKDLTSNTRADYNDDRTPIEVGQWYWVPGYENEKYNLSYFGLVVGGPEGALLMCVTHVGSNYVELASLSSQRHGKASRRIHLENFDEKTIYVPNAEDLFQKSLGHHRGELKKLMNEVRKVTALLGVSDKEMIGEQSVEANSTALALQNSNISASEYKKDLIRAKDQTLPDLFEKVKSKNQEIATLMSHEVVALSAVIDGMEEVKGAIEKRIFNVSLYAGLIEEVTCIHEGEPGAFHEQVHLFQKCLYMDEECLVNYEAGGMEFRDIQEFDEWLCRPEYMHRYLPYEKCIVAFQVRRNVKDRGPIESIADAFIRFYLEQKDKLTFLYMRNGEQVYRLSTDLEFRDLIFPSLKDFDPSSPMTVKLDSWGRAERFMNTTSFEKLKADEDKENEERRRNREQWFKDNPEDEWKKHGQNRNFSYKYANPFAEWDSTEYQSSSWVPFNKSSVYYDDISKSLSDKIEHYNRIALIMQGLLDRSEIFHPHPPIKTWKGDSFQQMVKLIYDGEMNIYNGEKPDFDAYKEKCNAQINRDSVFYGQDALWKKHVQRVENDRRAGSYKYYGENWQVNDRWTPEGNDGPQRISKPVRMSRDLSKATFEWMRRIENWRSENYGTDKVARFTAPTSELFNVSAYQPGDFKQFFEDPRTREEYLKWAPLLLACEDYYAQSGRGGK